MFGKNRIRLITSIILLFTIIEGISPVKQIIELPSEKENVLLWGLSLPRLLIMVALLILILFFIVDFLLLIFSEKYAIKIINLLSGIQGYTLLSVTSWQLLLLFIWLGFLNHNFGSWQPFYIRLHPLFFYLGLISINVILINFILLLNKKIDWKSKIEKKLSELKVPIFIFLILFLLWLIIGTTRLGITETQPFWGGDGSPIFGYQILIGMSLSTFFLTIYSIYVREKNENRKYLDIVICLVVWILASIFWIKAPIPHYYNVPKAMLPNYERYPYDGAAFYESNANLILIGEGGSQAFTSYRPLYPFFLSILHLKVGLDYVDVINLQSILLALSIPLLYLIGKKMHSRPVGVMTSILGIFIELNSIYSMPYTSVSNSKLMLTETLIMLFLLTSVFFLINWLKKLDNYLWNGLMGIGILAIGILLRFHLLFVIMVVILLAFFANKNQLRNCLKTLFLCVIIVLLAIVPWMTRNLLVVGEFSLLSSHLDRTLNQRWGTPEDEINIIDSGGRVIQISGVTFVLRGLSTYLYQVENSLAQIKVIISHFIHNEVLSVLSLPLSYKYQPISDYYENNKFDSHWNGKLSTSENIVLGINILIIAMGIGKSVERNKIPGLLPITIHLGYNLANSIARTSGGRYLKPTNWVYYLYFSVGVVSLLITLSKSIRERLKIGDYLGKDVLRNHIANRSIASAFLIVALFSSTISFAPMLFPKRYEDFDQEELLAEVLPILDKEMGNSQDEIYQMISSSKSSLFVGRNLYPKFYYSGQESQNKKLADNYHQYIPFHRLEFELVNYFRLNVIMPIKKSPKYFTNGADVIVLGCQEQGYIDAWAVFISDNINDGNFTMYMRYPYQELQCPLLLP